MVDSGTDVSHLYCCHSCKCREKVALEMSVYLILPVIFKIWSIWSEPSVGGF